MFGIQGNGYITQRGFDQTALLEQKKMPAGANREPESENTSLEDKLHFKNLTMEESIF